MTNWIHSFVHESYSSIRDEETYLQDILVILKRIYHTLVWYLPHTSVISTSKELKLHGFLEENNFIIENFFPPYERNESLVSSS